MKRTPYRAALTGIATDKQATTYAMNSAIRATEALVRAIARDEGVAYHGGRPERIRGESDVYTRVWTGDNGRVITAQAHPWSVTP
jgi:type II secretory pathway component PulC